MLMYMKHIVARFRKLSDLNKGCLFALSLFPGKFSLGSAKVVQGNSCVNSMKKLLNAFLIEALNNSGQDASKSVTWDDSSEFQIPSTVRDTIR